MNNFSLRKSWYSRSWLLLPNLDLSNPEHLKCIDCHLPKHPLELEFARCYQCERSYLEDMAS